ncbi:MAG: hypothetical protein M3O46_14365 [Myxococcota bacterium]|nr:hypothetical protein [Myxococcota bacterium]
MIASIAAASCRKDPQVTLRTVTMHTPQACAADSNTYAEFYALGDFEPTPPIKGHFLGNVGDPLPEIDDKARVLVALASENAREWAGVTTMGQSGRVDVHLLPWLTSCALSTPVDQRMGAALARMADNRVLIVGGAANPAPATFVLDMATGAIDPVSVGLSASRTRSSVTAFGDGALVAGGVSDGTVLATAVVYQPSLDGFDQQRPIEIGNARADQGAVVLATGETLLIGGVGADGRTPLASMEIVDPVTRTVRTERVAELSVARRAPIAIRLVSGEILVAAGFDASDSPVPTLEWFAADGTRSPRRPRDLVTGAARAFAPLDGGGALAVISAPPNAPVDFQNVWIIDADGALEAATPVQGTLTAPVLFGRAGGAPVLWTGDRWLRWQPWTGAFTALDVLDNVSARISDATCSPEAGLALWLAADVPKLNALRFDVRTEYAPLPHPLLVNDVVETAPDRLPTPGVLAFDESSGLVLGPGASVFVTDRTYADVIIDVDAPTGEPALIVLRDDHGTEVELGGASCPGVATPTTTSAHVARLGASLAWGTSGGATGTCTVGLREGARVSVGLRGPAWGARSLVRNLRLVRTRAP